MPKLKQSTLAELIDSDSDDGLAMPTPDSAAENQAPNAKKGRGRPKLAPTKPAPSKVTKTRAKAPTRRTSDRIEAMAKAVQPAPVKAKRAALKDRTNQHAVDDEIDDFAFDGDLVMEGTIEDSTAAVKKTKPKVTKKATTAKGKAGKDELRTESMIQETQDVSKPDARATKKRGPAKKQKPVEPEPEKIVQESQYEEMDIDAELDDELVDPEPETIVKPARNLSRTQSHSRQRQPSTQRRPVGNVSDTERGDPSLRRKLGDLTKKYETLNLKYQDLREIGIKEACRNFDSLKKEDESKTKTAGELINSLRADAAGKAALTKKYDTLKKKFDSQAAETMSLQAQIAQLTTSLTEARSENKTLSAKLAATRIAAASVESAHSRTPGSALKANGGIRLMGTAEAAQVAQAAQLKEDLYRDLTGLIIRGVKRETEEDIFDCLQTGGRNGTLHFKLATANEKSSESYDDAQCNYIPQLDPSRDKDLMELLPDYLVDEITFPRPQAAKFYARVVKALTEKVG
ncbi:uncharacterized protein L3040_001877 [Drepanopeziza brunnea f. sp. 'multigermtubi']|uniref:Chromosome segregation protein n=1 Tax=Marssonina brunnea f. sp. multigermtubi (strain MB_m1) TaxID=1072389 RepID=K1XG35_MARBU|nr:chromosome segregation protein [Drepanopeziza brunnea f. sp. 'multigermtubi' MB_m1]EKD19778.1 chromosome segregation protein [Drepanopeziza brunnea f. sp. 'multigermtubi' MB_m1]KAJ5052118.1 hypothetical protein L3040_001877 [Drepanopeziza brunnea f. sp. 'multigermtubi']